MQDIVVRIDHVTKHYKRASSPAVNDLSLKVENRSIFGLLGPNGAGKTTLISMLCGLFPPDIGSITINGFDVKKQSPKAKQQIGIVPQEIALYSKLTAFENLMFIGHMYGIATSELKKRIIENLQILGLESRKDEQVRTFSGGMKRRVNLIAGLLHYPKLLILDEPTVGADAQSRAAIIDHLLKLKQEKEMNIFYTSHHLKEAEELCTHVAIMDEGRLITQGKTDELIRDNDAKTLEEVYLKITGKRFRD